MSTLYWKQVSFTTNSNTDVSRLFKSLPDVLSKQLFSDGAFIRFMVWTILLKALIYLTVNDILQKDYHTAATKTIVYESCDKLYRSFNYALWQLS